MPSLADLQRTFHGAILGGQLPQLSVTGALSLADALSVHRGTAVGGLVNALRLSHPTVDSLVGEAYFDRVAEAYVLAEPSQRASLDGYGASFTNFLENYPSAQGLPYLGDVARLDWAIERTLWRSQAVQSIPLDAQVAIQLPLSLSLLQLAYPAHRIRDSLSDDAALAAINLNVSEYHLAIWRQHDTASVRVIRAPAALFLIALLSGAPTETAIVQGDGESQTASIIQIDIFAAPFCAVAPLQENTP